jgi:hypothetical protein
MERTCTQCRFFTPAQTWIEPPTWGQCTKRLIQVAGFDVQNDRPTFTWADGTCDDFEPSSQSEPVG